MINKVIYVGSLNPVKVNAVRNAFNKYFTNFEIFKIKADSHVPNQPIGMDLIIKGAINRAKASINHLIENKIAFKEIFGIGIEAGLVEVTYAKPRYMDFQFCVIMDENNDISIGSGVAFEYPPSVINGLFSQKDTEIGKIIGRLANNMNLKNEGGAISFLSQNVITREEILTQAVICALLPRINKELY